MAHNYLVTAHPPTAVSLCATGNFTAPDDLNLLLAKTNIVEIWGVTPEGLRSIKNFHINGKIEILQLFRLPVSGRTRTNIWLDWSWFDMIVRL